MRNWIFRSPKTMGIAAAGVLLVLGGTVWAVVAWVGGDGRPDVPKELTVASLQAQANDPAKIAQTMRETLERKDLSDEQRRDVRDNMRQVFEAEMDKSVDEYLTAPPEQKTAVIDRHLDRLQEIMKVMEPLRAQGLGRGGPGGASPDGRPGPRADGQNGSPPIGPPGQGNEARRPDGQDHGPGGWRGRMSTPEGRKQMSESRDPDRMARRMAYFGAILSRAKERGIEMPFPGGGRPPMGGMGGGPPHP